MLGAYKTMRDAVNPANLQLVVSNGDPVPDAFGAYDDGNFDDYKAVLAKYPWIPLLRFTVNSKDDEGDCLDVEAGDAKPADAPPWVLRRRAAGHTWVTVYCSLAAFASVRAAFVAAGVLEPWYIIAAYPGNGAQVYALPNNVGHQFADRGPYDETVLLPTYPLFPQPAPTPNGVIVPINGGRVHTIVTIPLDKNGNGDVLMNGSVPTLGYTAISPAIEFADVIACSKLGSNPPADGFWPGTPGAQDHGGFTLVTYTGGTPLGEGSAFITT